MSTLLNHEEIRENDILENTAEDRFGIASYDLRIQHIYPMDYRKKEKEYDLKPQGMVLATTKEKFKLPNDIIGYTTIRNTMSIKGLLALNIGLVDPGYEGPLSTILINFGKENFPLSTGDSVLRMTFHKINKPREINREVTKFVRDEYEEARENAVRSSVGSTFLNLEKTKRTIKKEILLDFLKWVGVLTLLVILFTFAINFGLDVLNLILDFLEKLFKGS
jgi:deoxycytidine triphosphate deaminase